MLGAIDRYKKPEKTRLFLCKPNRQIISELTDFFDPEVKFWVNGIHELNFSIPYKVIRQNKQVVNPDFHKVKGDYLIRYVKGKVDEYFVIKKTSDSASEKIQKSVQCYLQPYSLVKTLIRNYKGTKKLFDPVGSDGFLNDTLIKKTNWSVGYVDGDLITKFRTVDVSEQNLIEFIESLNEAFNCICVWDTKNKSVSFLKEESWGADKGLLLEEGIYLKSLNGEPDFENVAVRAYFYGKDDLTFNTINPTGTDFLENYSYYLHPFSRDENKNVLKESHYMTNELCHALLDYSELVESKQGDFTNLISQKETHQVSLTTKENELNALEIDMKIIEDQLDIAKSLGQPTTELDAQYATKLAQVNAKKSEIVSVKLAISNIDSQITTIKNQIAIENNFTPELIVELNEYQTKQTIITNQFITDEKELYEFAKKEMVKICQPLIHYSIDIVDFTKVVQCQRDWDKLVYGDIITIRYPKLEVDIKARIISIVHNEGNNSIQLEIANATDIKNGFLKFKDIVQKVTSTSTRQDMSKSKWDKSEQNAESIASFINDDIRATNKRIVAGVNESVEISRKGLRIINPNFPDEMLIAQAGVLALSQDGGNTWKTAIKPDRIVADVVMGKLLAGVNLTIENESGKYTMDDNGFTIQGDAFTMSKGENGINISPTSGLVVTRGDDKVRSIFNATEGIKIEVKKGTTWEDSFFLDIETSEMTFKGVINADELKVKGSSVLTADKLKINGQYIDKIKVEQLDATTAKIGTAMIENLVVGGNVQMGASATISWSQVSNQPFIPTDAAQIGGVRTDSPRLTRIDVNGIYTGTVDATNLIGQYIRGIDWMSNSDSTPFNIYIGSIANLASQFFYDSFNLYKNGTRYFRVDQTGVYHNGQPIGGGTAKFA